MGNSPKQKVIGKATFTTDGADPSRTLTAQASLHTHAVKTKNPPPPLFFADAQQDVTVGGNYDRGHLIAESFGGPNSSFNIVPLFSFLNRRGDWKQMESNIAQLRSQGLVQHMAVTVVYAGNSGIPSEFIIRASLIPLPPPTQANAPQGGQIQPREDTSTQSYCWRVENRLPPRRQLQDSVEVLGYQALFAAEEESYFKMYESEIEMGEEFPPYHFLEFINEKHQMVNIAPKGTPTLFTPQQKTMILAYNAYASEENALNDTMFVTSDSPFDSFPELNLAGCKDSPQIDHARPFSMGGNNSFLNAQVLSEAYNSQKRAKYTLTQDELDARRRTGRRSKPVDRLGMTATSSGGVRKPTKMRTLKGKTKPKKKR